MTVFLIALLLSPLAHAAEPPALLWSLPPVYPAAALALEEEASVLLEIDVGADGGVLDVRVVETAGPDFDAAALQAARDYRFSPPLDDAGAPTAMTLRYRTVFTLDRAPPLSVEGRLLQAGTREPLDGAQVTLTRGDRAVRATTDPSGAFRVAGLDDGAWQVQVSTDGVRPETATVEVQDGRVAQVTLYAAVDRPWDVEAEGVSESIEVVGRRTAPEITERVLTADEARVLPGTGGDVVRVVQNLPGVARPPLNIGQLLIRGTAPEDSAYYLDGAQIPLVFHFAGFSTVLNGDTLAEIAYLPGNYGVRYGRTVGGVVDLRLQTDLPDRSSGYASVDLIQTTLFAEQRIGERVAVTLSGRRSYVDAILNPILAGTSDATIQAPRYYDLQLRLLGQTARGGSLDTMFLLSDDRFEVVGADADDVEQVQIGLTTTFQKIRIHSEEPLGRGWRNEASVMAGPERQAFAVPGGEAYEAPFTLSVRDEAHRAAPDRGVGLGLRVGMDTQLAQSRLLYDVPGFGEAEEADVLKLAPAVYVEPSIRLGRWLLVPGLRVDALQLGAAYVDAAVDPRLAARVDLGSTTTFKGSAGGYSQWPTVRQALDNPDLGALRSWQGSVGVEQRLGPSVGIEVATYANQLTELVSGREDAFRFFSGPPPVGPLDTGAYANDGTGQVVGVEGIVKAQTDRSTAWLSATVSRSTRVDRPGDEVALFEYDQPVVLTALATHQLGRGWRVGGRARYGSGNPYTPVVNRFLDLDARTYRPVYGELDSARLPGFWQLDLRVDKRWVYDTWALSAYLDLQNATNAQNVEVMAWTFDYAEEDPITQIPVVPAFGLRGEW